MTQPRAMPEPILTRAATAWFTTVDLDHPLVLAGGTVRAVTAQRHSQVWYTERPVPREPGLGLSGGPGS